MKFFLFGYVKSTLRRILKLKYLPNSIYHCCAYEIYLSISNILSFYFYFVFSHRSNVLQLKRAPRRNWMAVEIRFIFDDNGKICPPAKKIKWSKEKKKVRKQTRRQQRRKQKQQPKDKNEYYINSISLDYQKHCWQIE